MFVISCFRGGRVSLTTSRWLRTPVNSSVEAALITFEIKAVGYFFFSPFYYTGI